MSKVQPLGRERIVSIRDIEAARDLIDMAERGEVTELVLTANVADDGYHTVASFSDRMRIIGYLMSQIMIMYGAGGPQRDN